MIPRLQKVEAVLPKVEAILQRLQRLQNDALQNDAFDKSAKAERDEAALEGQLAEMKAKQVEVAACGRSAGGDESKASGGGSLHFPNWQTRGRL